MLSFHLHRSGRMSKAVQTIFTPNMGSKVIEQNLKKLSVSFEVVLVFSTLRPWM